MGFEASLMTADCAYKLAASVPLESAMTHSTVLPFSRKSRLTSCPSRYIGKLNSIDFKGISDSPLGYNLKMYDVIRYLRSNQTR